MVNAVLFFVAWCCASIALAASHVGLRVHESENLTYGVWYPTQAAPNLKRLGPFDVSLAKDALPMSGRFPVVMLSHGNGGRWRNHYLTAAALASQGLVVIAPQHTRDTWVGTSRTDEAMAHRSGDLARALDHVLRQPDLSNVADASKLFGLGYSLGGATVLHAAGVGLDLPGADRHCESHAPQDAAFCEPPPIWQRVWARLTALASGTRPALSPPMAFQRMALVAPVGQGLSASDLRKIKSPVLLLRIQDDAELREPFHAAQLKASLKSAPVQMRASLPGHHYAFIGPFPAWLLKEEPTLIDPPGFDRFAFIQSINQDLIRFFKGTTP
jgi:predicted dienelactone hydrolase